MEQSLKRFRDSVDGLYAGQEDAVHSITKVLYSGFTVASMARPRSYTSLLSFKPFTIGIGKLCDALLCFGAPILGSDEQHDRIGQFHGGAYSGRAVAAPHKTAAVAFYRPHWSGKNAHGITRAGISQS